MAGATLRRLSDAVFNAALSVPVRLKITGIILMTVLILGLSLNYWVTTSLSDWLSYLLTDIRVDAAMRAGGRSILLVTVLAAAGSLVLASLLTFLLTRPLLDLREMARQVAGGHLDARAPVYARDEIGEVAVAINQMTDHLVAAQDDLARTNRRLTAINQVMLAAERENEIHDVLYAILQSTLSHINLTTGWVYLRDPEREVLHLASWTGVPPAWQLALLQARQEAMCACQQELTAGVLGAAGVRTCSRLSAAAAAAPPRRHITLPIEARGQRYGVINLVCPDDRAVGPEEMGLLSAIGAQVSEIVASAWLRLKLAEKEASRQALLESLVEAQEEERGRLARELHDGAGQMLTSLLVHIKTLEKQAAAPGVRQGLAGLLEMVAETIEQIRELSYRLRPAALAQFGLPVALQILVDEMTEEANIEATCRLDLAGVELPPGMDVTLYRVAQEAVTNVLRHAGAGHLAVTLAADDHSVAMRIADDGTGFDPHRLTAAPGTHHLGLIGMRERVAMAGGELDVLTAPGQGTTILVRLPLPELVSA